MFGLEMKKFYFYDSERIDMNSLLYLTLKQAQDFVIDLRCVPCC